MDRKEGGGEKDGRRIENIEYCSICTTRIFVGQRILRSRNNSYHPRCVRRTNEVLLRSMEAKLGR